MVLEFMYIQQMMENIIIGKEEANSVNTRLRQHRTSYPRFRLEYVVYTKDAGLLETLMLKR